MQNIVCLNVHHNLTKTQSKMIPRDSVYICQNILKEKDIDASLHAFLPLFGPIPYDLPSLFESVLFETGTTCTSGNKSCTLENSLKLCGFPQNKNDPASGRCLSAALNQNNGSATM